MNRTFYVLIQTIIINEWKWKEIIFNLISYESIFKDIIVVSKHLTFTMKQRESKWETILLSSIHHGVTSVINFNSHELDQLFSFFFYKKIQFKSHKIELKTYNFPTSDKQHKTYYYLKSNSPIDGRVRYWLNWWVHLLWRWCLISRPDPLAQTPPVWPPPDVSHYAHLRATLHWAPVAADSATSKQSFQNICL